MSKEFINIPVPVERVDEVYELLGRRPTRLRADRPGGESSGESVVVQAYRQTTDAMRGMLDILADDPGQWIPAGKFTSQLGLTDEQFGGQLGGFTNLMTLKLKLPLNESWFFESQKGGDGYREYRASADVALEIRQAKEAFERNRGR